MPGDGRVTLVLAAAAAATCLATGVAYLVSAGPSTPEGGEVWFGTLALLGGSLLGAAGLWQYRGEGVPRLLALVFMSMLAAAYVAANTLALVASVEGSIPGAPLPLHGVGVAVGAVSYVVTLVEASLAFRARPRAD
ncbi:MAG: hypothetical protein ACXWYJ_11935 [Actinomycetota bacterium]